MYGTDKLSIIAIIRAELRFRRSTAALVRAPSSSIMAAKAEDDRCTDYLLSLAEEDRPVDLVGRRRRGVGEPPADGHGRDRDQTELELADRCQEDPGAHGDEHHRSRTADVRPSR